MKVLLANPPWKKGGDRFGVRAGSRWPFTMVAPDRKSLGYIPFPFFLACATALLERERSLDVMAIDAIAEGLDEEEYLAELTRFRPDLVIAETSTASFGVDRWYASETRARMGGLCVYVLAGPHVSAEPRRSLEETPDADYCLIGEYEYSLRDLVMHIAAGSTDKARSVPGVAARTPAGITVNERRPLQDINTLPWPAYHHFPMYSYRDYFCSIPAPMANMLASRGCPYTCNFCLWPDVMFGGQAYRARDPRDVVDEMQFLVSRYGFRTLYFDDDTFNIGKPRMLELSRLIRSKRLDICWAIMARADTVDREALAAMRDAGLIAAKFGVESGNQQVLDMTSKRLKLETVMRTVGWCKELGIRLHLTFSIGLLGESHESIEDTIRLAKRLDPESLQFSISTPFPGTRYHKQARERGLLLVEDVEIFDGAASCVVRTEALTREEIEAGYARVREQWEQHVMRRERRGRVVRAVLSPRRTAAKLVEKLRG